MNPTNPQNLVPATPAVWQADAPIAAHGTWLLEASAGTGKTWQLASLVARLVAEYGLTIDRVLVITFTNAATTELRDRIRKRLVDVRTELQARPADAPIADAVRAERLQRVERALSSFDLAAISTIHGFCQRMLETLAFESGQETDLSLLEDTREIQDRFIADALASVQADASAEDWRSLRDLGWQEKVLRRVVEQASSAGRMTIQPVSPVDLSPFDVLRAHDAAAAALLAWWTAATGGQALVADLLAEAARPTSNKTKAPKQLKSLAGRTYTNKAILTNASKVAAWLADGAATSVAMADGKLAGFLAMFTQRKATESPNPNHPDTFVHAGLQHVEDQLAVVLSGAGELLAAVAARAQRHLEEELRARHQLSFNAILQRLADAVSAETGAHTTPLADAIRGLFDVALVDEFQDTDSNQWAVLRHVFHDQPTKRLFLIGDPKQAIYAFRGADVFVYLAAKGITGLPIAPGAPGQYTMTTNYRSDGDYVAAMNTLWGLTRQVFGALEMDYIRVGVPATTPPHRLVNLPGVAAGPTGAGPVFRDRRPLELRWLSAGLSDAGVPRRPANKAAARLSAAACCAAEIGRLLAHPSARRWSAPDEAPRRLQPRDIAVLVNTGREGIMVKRALARIGVMAVAAGKGSVFQSGAAGWLLQLLDALAAPGHEGRIRTLAVSPLFGWSLAELGTAIDDANGPLGGGSAAGTWPQALHWERWREALNRAAHRWSTARFSGVVHHLLQTFGVLERVLRLEDGERHATDLRHLIELGHAEERQFHLSATGLADWLRKHRAVDDARAADTDTLRLESDAEAVHIVTLHKSKGLQYPIVMLPFAWSARPPEDKLGPMVVHPWRDAVDVTPEQRATPVLDLNPPKSPARIVRHQMAMTEFLEEETRKLYVALTRAAHHCVVWLGGVAPGVEHAAVHRLVFPGDDATVAAASATIRAKKPERVAVAQQAIDEAVSALIGGAMERFQSGFVGFSVDSRPGQGDVTALRQAVRARWARPSTSPRAQVIAAPDPDPAPDLAHATLGTRRHIQSSWQRASYSSMTSGRGMQADGAASSEALTVSDVAAGADDGAAGQDARHYIAALARRPAVPPELMRALADQPLPLARMWGGAGVGVWAHAVFEHLDFATPTAAVRSGAAVEAAHASGTLADEAALVPLFGLATQGADAPTALQLAVALGSQHGHTRSADHHLLVLALPGILTTALDAPEVAAPWRLPSATCLADIAPRDRLDEMSFDLRIAGGERSLPAEEAGQTRKVDVDAIAVALRGRLTQEPGWDGRGWLQPLLSRAAAASSAPAFQRTLARWQRQPVGERGAEPQPWAILPPIRGILTGIIDLVFRVPADVPGGARYYLADYKSSRLTNAGDRHTTAAHYERDWLAWSMGHSAYHLQSLIYSVALHRFLGARVPGYDYDLHMGGHLYLYLRGMEGPAGRTDADRSARGVYHDRWPKEVVLATNAALEATGVVGAGVDR